MIDNNSLIIIKLTKIIIIRISISIYVNNKDMIAFVLSKRLSDSFFSYVFYEFPTSTTKLNFLWPNLPLVNFVLSGIVCMYVYKVFLQNASTMQSPI